MRYFSTFCLLDAMKNALIVTLYNFVPDFGVVIGQTVAIPEPWLTEVSVKVDVDETEFPCVRVATPAILVINGQRVHPSAVAMCEAVPTNL